MDEKVELPNETILNIYRNYIPNKNIKYDYHQPPWMTDSIRKSLKERSKLTKIFYKNGQRKTDREKYWKKLLNVLTKLPPFSYKTNLRMNSFNVSESDILSIIKSLNSTK